MPPVMPQKEAGNLLELRWSTFINMYPLCFVSHFFFTFLIKSYRSTIVEVQVIRKGDVLVSIYPSFLRRHLARLRGHWSQIVVQTCKVEHRATEVQQNLRQNWSKVSHPPDC